MKIVLRLLVLSFICIALSANEVQEWKPLDHPAKLIRSITSFTEASAFVDVKAEYDGRLLDWKAKEGVTLNSKEEKVFLVQQDDKLAKLALEREEASLISQKQLLKTREAEQALLKRELAFRKLEQDRIADLAKEGKVPTANYDRAVFEYDRTALSLKQSAEAVALQKQAIKEQAVAVARAQETLSRYKLYAKKGWVLDERILESGSWVAAGQVIARLADLREYSVYIRLNDKEYRSFKKLNAKKIQLKSVLDGKNLIAKLHRIDQRFDPVSRKRLLELRVDNSKANNIETGTELKLEIEMPYPQPVVEVPEAFTFKKYERLHVKTKDGQDIAINPLRRVGGKLYLNASIFSKDTVLVKP